MKRILIIVLISKVSLAGLTCKYSINKDWLKDSVRHEIFWQNYKSYIFKNQLLLENENQNEVELDYVVSIWAYRGEYSEGYRDELLAKQSGKISIGKGPVRLIESKDPKTGDQVSMECHLE